MFLAAIRSAAAPSTPVSPSSEQWPLGPHFVCELQCDAARFRVSTKPPGISVVDIPSGQEVFSLDTDASRGMVQKPLMFGLLLYYVATDSSLLVSTHIRLLQRHGVELRDDASVLPEYFVYRYVTPPKTLFRGISRMPVGSSLRFRVDGSRLALEPLVWTDVFEKRTDPLPFERSVEIIAADLVDGMRALSGWRGQLACLLSGGVDSSILYKLGKEFQSIGASHSTGYPFEDPAQNEERMYAETAADMLGSTHTYHEFTTAEFLHGIIEAIEHGEGPLIHLQTVLLNLVFGRRLAPSDRLVLCGQGADGIFGLSVMFNYQKYKWLVHSRFAPAMNVIARTPLGRGFPWQRMYQWSKRNWSLDLAAPNHALTYLGEFGDRGWVKQHFNASDRDIFATRMNAIQKFELRSIHDAFSILDFVSDVAVTQDTWGKLAAAHGRFVHYPYNSQKLIEAAANTSWEEKLAEPKRLIRTAGERVGVPREILSRPKLGFGIQSAKWARAGGIAEPFLAVAAPVVDPAVLRQLQGADEKRAMTFWTWINYAVWKRLFVNGEPSERLHTELDEAIQQIRPLAPSATG